MPGHLPAGSDVANLSLLGYDPAANFTGRAPLEAAAQGIELGPQRLGHPLQSGHDRRPDHAGFHGRAHLDGRGRASCLHDAAARPGRRAVGVPRRASATATCWSTAAASGRAPFSAETRTTPPHDLTDKSVVDDFPRGPGSDLLNDVMNRTVDAVCRPSGQCRAPAAGQAAGHQRLAVGPGEEAAACRRFASVYGKRGAMITAVDLLRGLAALIGWERIEVPGATGYTDTDYAAKGRYAVAALADTDLVCVHVEATDEASHEGDVAGKMRALEEIDRHIVRPAARGAAAARRLPHPGLARSSHAAADQDAQPRVRAVRHVRDGHSARRAATYDEPRRGRPGVRGRLDV